jgi:hypothetical protein
MQTDRPLVGAAEDDASSLSDYALAHPIDEVLAHLNVEFLR